MAKKILKTLTNNLGFKILAVFLSAILWLVVYNIDDPVISRVFTTSVTFVNENTVTNKYYEVINNTNTVSFSISAKRSQLDKLDNSDFTATADFAELVMNPDGTKASVKIDITPTRYANAIKINGSSKYLELSIEDAKSKQFVVAAASEGTVAEGYALGNVSIKDSNVIKVSGPQSLVDQIVKIVATINVDGMSQNLSDSVVPVLYDAEENEIDTTKLTLSKQTVNISADILSTKKITLNVSTSGTPAEGYSYVGMTTSANTVWLKGTAASLNAITTLDIPAETLNIEGATSEIDTTINITDYLPSGVELLNIADAMVSIVIDIEPFETREFLIPVSNITIEGLAEENELSFASGNYSVDIRGISADLDSLSANSIQGSIDVTGMSTGSHVVDVTLVIDETKYTATVGRIQINITKKETTAEEDQGDTSENSSQDSSRGDTDLEDTNSKDTNSKDTNSENTDSDDTNVVNTKPAEVESANTPTVNTDISDKDTTDTDITNDTEEKTTD